MNKLAKNYIYTLAYQVLNLISPIITAPYLSRVLGASNLGIYSYVLSSGSIIATLSMLGIYTYGNRQIAYVREDKNSLSIEFWNIFYIKALLGIFGTFAYFAYSLMNSEITLFFIIYYPALLSEFIDCSWLFVGMEDMFPPAFKNFCAKLANVVGIFLLVKDSGDLFKYFALVSGTSLIANISIFGGIKRYVCYPQKINKSIDSVKKHLKGSLILFLPQVASLFYLQIDKVMIKWITGASEQVSFYDQAEKIVTIPLSIITVMSTVIMPRLANEFNKNNTKNIEELVTVVGKIAVMVSVPMTIGMIAISRQFIPWYLGEEFTPTITCMCVISPIIIFNTLTNISGTQFFVATNQANILLKANVTAAVLNLIINAILIPKYYYVGAGLATLISSLSLVIVQYWHLSKQIDVRYIIPSLIKYGTYSLIMYIIIRVTTISFPAKVYTTIAQIAIGVVYYLLILTITNDFVFRKIIDAVLKRK